MSIKGLKRMESEKKTYYISMANGEIMQTSTASPWNFKIEATDQEIIKLREFFDQNYSADWQSFFRAHVPYVQYHYDRENDAYDKTLEEIYRMIFELGDESAKEHIRSIGILPEFS
jgi:hypothetical protein